MRKYTEQEKKRYWMARCPECGWKGLTCDCNGFGPLADTGDYCDGFCPKCDAVVDDDEETPKRYLLWLFRKITFYRVRNEISEKLWEYKMEKRIKKEMGEE